MSTPDNPKIFISYSWSPKQHKEKTIKLAERLMADGIDVVLDVWDLNEGQDKNTFMEQMVNSKDIKRVLLICNKTYVEKANNREGGVGTESLIISEEVYSNSEQIKYVPVIFEKDPENNPFLPTYVKSRIYIDLSDEEYFEEEYDKLIRNIYNQPLYKKPSIGKRPKYLDDETPPSVLANKILQIKNAAIEEKSYKSQLIEDFFEEFISGLKEYEINLSSIEKEIDEEVLDKINALECFRIDFISLVNTIIRYTREDLKSFHSFFESFLQYIISAEVQNAPPDSNGYLKNDHYRYLQYELFLLFAGILLEKGCYEELGYVLHTPYIPFNSHKNEYVHLPFMNLNLGVYSLNVIRIRRLNQNNINEVSKVLRSRNKDEFSSKSFISEVDALLYYVSCLTVKDVSTRLWFPHTCDTSDVEISILGKLRSHSFFNKFKTVLYVHSVDELRQKIEFVDKLGIDKLNKRDYGLGYISYVFQADLIGSLR